MCCLESRTGILRSQFPPLRLLLFAVGRMNTSSVTRQLWSIWEVLITMQHKKPSLCRLYQPLQSWKASSDPGGALELTKLTQKKYLFIWTMHREQGGGLEGTPLRELHVVTWPSQRQLGRAARNCSGTSGGVRWGGRMDTGKQIQQLQHTLGNVSAGEGKEKPTLVTSLEFSLFTNIVGSL